MATMGRGGGGDLIDDEGISGGENDTAVVFDENELDDEEIDNNENNGYICNPILSHKVHLTKLVSYVIVRSCAREHLK